VGIDLPAQWVSAPFDWKGGWHFSRTSTYINLPAVLVTAGCTLVLLAGVKTSAVVNNVIVVAKVIAILVVVFVGAAHMHPSLWHPYIPQNTGVYGVYGWSGVFQGTAILFFAYIGFDAVSTMGQEVRNPQRAVPLSLLLGLGICAVLYLAVSFVVTGLVSYKDLDVPDPLYLVLDRTGRSVLWAKSLVGLVALVGLVSVLLVTLMGQVRIFYAMGRDGLLPAAFARVHLRTRTPHVGTIVTGVVSCIAAGVLPLDVLADIISMGTLLAFGIVCGGVLVLRRTRPDLPRPFKAPGGIWVPLAGALCCAGLMATLPSLARKGFLVWLVIGLAVYVLYGATRSKLQRVAQH
jgi:APA family basic amino acid/polyamine antiporter